MTPPRWVIRLGWLIAALALLAAGVGLLAGEGSDPVAFTTVRGGRVFIQGQGLYRYDSLFIAAGNRGLDAVTITLAVPLLLLSLPRCRRGSSRAALLLGGCLGYFLYVYASMALGTAWNELFLVYVALLAASLFALGGLLGSREMIAAAPRLFGAAPRRGPAIFLVAAGLITLLVWLAPVVAALVQGAPPPLLDHYTTTVTYALDLAIVAPTTCLAGALIWRRRAVGYLLALPLIGLVILLGPVIAASTACQLLAGISFGLAEVVGPIASFVVLAGLAVWVLVAILRAVPESVATDGRGRAPLRLQGEAT